MCNLAVVSFDQICTSRLPWIEFEKACARGQALEAVESVNLC